MTLAMTNQTFYCETASDLRQAYRLMKQHDMSALGLDTETNGLNPFAEGAQLVLVQAATADGFTIVADARRIEPKVLFGWLKTLFSDSESIKIFHNAPFDLAWLMRFGREYGLTMPLPLHDTMVTERLLTAGLQEDCRLTAVCERYLGYKLDKTQQTSFLTLGDDDLDDDQLEYGAKDVTVLVEIMDRQFALLQNKRLETLYRLEMDILPVTVEMHLHGVLIDIERWQAHIESLKAEAGKREQALTERLQPYLVAARKAQGFNQAHHYYDRNDWLAAVSEWEADAQGAYDAIIERNRKAIAVWEADYLAVKAEQGSKAAAAWRKENPKPGEGRGEAQFAKRQWQADHPKPEFMGETIQLTSGQQKAAALLALGVPLPETDGSRVKRKQDPTIPRQYATKRGVLKKFADEFPIVSELVELNGYQKLIQSFGESIIEKADAYHRLHPRFDQLGAEATGRFSCREPNVQQIPGNELGAEFRHCFIAGPGRIFYTADYSQIELRLLAEFSQEPALLWSFDHDVDLHSLTALKMFEQVQDGLGVTPEAIDAMLERAKTNECILEQVRHLLERVKEEYGKYRKWAKVINFGIPYGQTKFGFSEGMGITPDEAQVVIDAYFAANPGVREWLDRTSNEGLRRYFVRTPLGRKRFYHPITEDQRKDKQLLFRVINRYKRTMCNQPIQGASADVTKMAMVRIDRALKAAELDAQIVLCVHDEIVVECAVEQGEAVREIVDREMTYAAKVVLKRCPVKAEGKLSHTWEH